MADDLARGLNDITLSSSEHQSRSDEVPSGNGGRRSQSPAQSDAGISVSGGSSGGPPGLRRRDAPHNFIELAQRPGVCKDTLCTRVSKVTSNYYRLKLPRSVQVFQYNIEFFKAARGNGPQTPLTKREKTADIFWCLYNDNRNVFPEAHLLVYNDVNILFTAVQLRLDGGVGEFTVYERARDPATGKYPPIRRDARAPSTRVRITVAPKEKVDDVHTDNQKEQAFLTCFLDLLLSQQHRCPLSPHFGKFVTQGRALFEIPRGGNESKTISIGGGQEVWTGLHGAIKTDTQAGILLNVDSSNSVFYKREMNLVNFYCEVVSGYRLNGREVDWEQAAMRHKDVMTLLAAIKGVRVAIKYPGGERVSFKKVTGISDKTAKDSYFRLDTGESLSVAQYFLNKYGFRLEAPNLPCIQFKPAAGSRVPIQIPMELCYTTDEPRKFKGRICEGQLAAMIQASARRPHEQLELLRRMTRSDGEMLNADDTSMKQYGLEVEREFLPVTGKFLHMPRLNFPGNERMELPLDTAEHPMFLEDSSGRKMPLQAIKKPNIDFVPYFVIAVEGNRPGQNQKPEERMNQRRLLFDTCSKYGLKIAHNFEIEAVEDLYHGKDVNVDQIKFLIEQAQSRTASLATEHKVKAYPIIFWIFPIKHAALYTAVKYYCDVHYGVVSQILMNRVFVKLIGNSISNNTATNIMLKVLAKCGGQHYAIDRNVHKNWAKVTNPDDPTLFLAIDVSHPGAEERFQAKQKELSEQTGRGGRSAHQAQQESKKPRIDDPRSVFAVVGNIDIDAMHYEYSARIQRTGQENGDHITEQVYQRIEAFYKHTGKYPKHIVVYRDGVSESEFKKTLYEEKDCIDNAKKKFTNMEATLTYIVAQKRHHTRFYAKSEEDASGPSNNVRPGLLVEDTVVSRSRFDFFLTSHFGPLGTSKPTHYTVLHDDWMPSPAFWQTVVFAHCFGYARTPRAISLPAPLMYGHLAAKKAKGHFDFWKMSPECPPQYNNNTEPLVLQQMEQDSITVHTNLQGIKAMTFC